MKANGDYELSEVPGLLERGGIRDLLNARSALVNAAGDLLSASTSAALRVGGCCVDCAQVKPVEANRA
jgi:hypothetical protein